MAEHSSATVSEAKMLKMRRLCSLNLKISSDLLVFCDSKLNTFWIIKNFKIFKFYFFFFIFHNQENNLQITQTLQ